MRGVKCFGLLLVFSIIFGLSLNASSDVSALKYSYNAFNLASPTYVKGVSSGNSSSRSGFSFSISFYTDNSLSYDPDIMDRSKASFWLCDQEQIPGNLNNIWSTPSFISSSHSFGFSNHHLFNQVVFSQEQLCYSSTAARWSYDSIYSADYNMSNGDTMKLVDIPNLFFDSGDSYQRAGSLKSINIPLNIDYDSLGVIEQGTTLEWDVGLVQKSANNFPYFDPDAIATMDISYFTLNPNTSSFDDFWDSWKTTTSTPPTISVRPQCTIDDNYRFQVRSNELWQDYLGINVHCSYTAPSDLYYVNARVLLSGSNSNFKLLDYDYNGLYFSGSYLITNGDDTWSGQYANRQPTGDNLEEAPGYHQLYGYDNPGGCVEGDFFCDLSNLFNFNFINPFAPIFNLFTDQNSCAQIPTLAGMLHSVETQVCPWFDSTTRNIVTPVLGLSSMMLLFGFAVRWLGSRSGNFIEDSEGFDSGGLHFQNKFRRK